MTEFNEDERWVRWRIGGVNHTGSLSTWVEEFCRGVVVETVEDPPPLE